MFVPSQHYKMRCYKQLTVLLVGAKIADSSAQNSLPKSVDPIFQGLWTHSNHSAKSVRPTLLHFWFQELPPIELNRRVVNLSDIYVVHTPTHALIINLVKSFKFTLKYTMISLLHVSVFNDHHQGALSVPN